MALDGRPSSACAPYLTHYEKPAICNRMQAFQHINKINKRFKEMVSVLSRLTWKNTGTETVWSVRSADVQKSVLAFLLLQ